MARTYNVRCIPRIFWKSERQAVKRLRQRASHTLVKRQEMKRKILMALFSVALQAAPARAQQDVATLDKSSPMVAKSTAAQRFADYINLDQGQVRLPLTLTFYNGTDKAPGFSWLRVSIGGRPAYTERDFRGGKVFADKPYG